MMDPHGSVLTSEAATVLRSIGSRRALLGRRALILALIIPMNEVLTGTHRAHRLQQNPKVAQDGAICVFQHRRTPLLCGRQDDRAVIPERLGRPPQSRRVLLHRREDDLAIPMRGPRSAYRIRSELDQLPIVSQPRGRSRGLRGVPLSRGLRGVRRNPLSIREGVAARWLFRRTAGARAAGSCAWSCSRPTPRAREPASAILRALASSARPA